MKKMIIIKCGLMALLFAGVGTSAAAQQTEEKVNYIIVRTANGEIASFYPPAVQRQFIEDGNWVFELKTNVRHSYPLSEILPFTLEARPTDVQPVTVSDWRVYDDGACLVIENPGGAVGRYAVYSIEGRLIASGYESGSKVSIPAPAGVCIVKAGMDVKKAVKK